MISRKNRTATWGHPYGIMVNSLVTGFQTCDEHLEAPASPQKLNPQLRFRPQNSRFRTQNDNSNYINPMDEFAISDVNITRMSEVLKQLKQAVVKKTLEDGDAQTATVNRDEAVEKFLDWSRRYKKVEKIALAPYPRLLVKLGL